MRGSLIRHVDPWQEAARGARYEAELAAVRLPRLCALAEVLNPLRVAISFEFAATKRGAVQVELHVSGSIEMDCQRCLEPLTMELAVHNRVWIVRDDAAARAIESSTEAIVSAPGEHLELAVLVEDEALLGMPFAPCHPVSECEVHLQGHSQRSWQADSAVVYETEEDVVLGKNEVQNPNADTGAGLDHATGSGALPGHDVRAQSGAAQAGNELAGVEARRNPFAVLASLRDGHCDGVED